MIHPCRTCVRPEMRLLLPVLSLLLVWHSGGAGTQQDPLMPFMEYLDADHSVSLTWGFNKVQGTIRFALQVQTTGWVCLGFSPNGGMAGADMVIGGVGPNGKYFTDRHATGNYLPVEDQIQSYTLLSLREVEGQTTMMFERSIESCDNEDFHITASPIKLIYAYGTTDEIKYHGALRGTKEINLLDYMPRSAVLGPDYINFTVKNITIPSTHTYYHCSMIMIPRMTTKHHVYLVEPVITNVDIVHHMLLYGCPAFVNQTYDGPCYAGDAGDNCIRAEAAWGVGGGVYEYPDNAGVPIGSKDKDVFYRLEIHYNNPTAAAGRRDSSGLRLYYTDKLREHDVGILTTGVIITENYRIPARVPQFHTYGTCNTTLFSQLIKSPVPDLQVFSLLLHTHLAGRKIRAGLFRNGQQVEFLGLDENYNFELQQTSNLGNIKTIKPGDNIVVECTYSTANRTQFTKMGLSTTDEMCLAFIFYYPAIDINVCLSEPIMAYVNLTQSNQVLNTSSPDPDAVSKYENMLKTVPQLQVVQDAYHNYAVNLNGSMGNMMKTPSVTCARAPGDHGCSWVVAAAGLVLLLLNTVL